MVNLDKFSYIGLFSGGSAASFGGGDRGRGGAAPGGDPAAAPAAPSAPVPLDLKTIYSGAMADPAEFNQKVKVLFYDGRALQSSTIRTGGNGGNDPGSARAAARGDGVRLRNP